MQPMMFPTHARHLAIPPLAGWALWAMLVLASLCPPAAATEQVADIPAICETAAVQAAKASGVPISVLKAISMAATGRKHQGSFRPWPWTVNMEGKGMWFDSREEALAYATQNFDRGARSFDVGCFQINYNWHNKAFASIEQMFDPLANALYAAEFLQSLYAEKGSWPAAVGAYHSRNVQYATGYQARFEKIRARFAPEDGQPLPEVSGALLQAATGGVDPQVRSAVIRINTYPLLQPGEGLLGSLVPQGAAAGISLLASAGPTTGLLGPMTDSAGADAEVPELTADQAGALAEATGATQSEQSSPLPGAIY